MLKSSTPKCVGVLVTSRIGRFRIQLRHSAAYAVGAAYHRTAKTKKNRMTLRNANGDVLQLLQPARVNLAFKFLLLSPSDSLTMWYDKSAEWY